MDRRLCRLEKTVESLSHGLILALMQLKSGDVQEEPRCRHCHKTESGNDCCDLSTAFAGKGPLENGMGTSCYFGLRLLTMSMCAAHGGIAMMVSPLQTNNTELSSPLKKELIRSGPQLSSTATATTSVASKAGPENMFSCIATGSNDSLFTTSKEMSHSRMLSPILKFITSSDVFEFLKRVEIHASLWSTQLFDLFWVLDNLFNVHGGVRFCFSLASRDQIILIIRYCRF
jgi:hypothetical protein